MHIIKRSFLLPIVAATALAGACQNQRPSAADVEETQAPVSAAQPNQAPQATSPTPATASLTSAVSCQPTAAVGSAVGRILEQADNDADGRISRTEAQSFLNFVVGGVFFRADANADGKVSPEEGRQARMQLAGQYPTLDALLRRTRDTTGESPFRLLANVTDVNYGQPLTMEEARRASDAALADLYSAVDGNRDGIISADEARATSWEAARVVGKQIFSSADSNNDGALETKEFEGAVASSAQVVFSLADADKNGRLSEQEAAVAMDSIVRRLGIPQTTPQG